MSTVTTIRGLTPRLNVVGRIRAGAKTKTSGGKERPTSIDTFRFTSQDRDLIEAIAGHYGGEVSEWVEPKAPGRQWQVTTDASKIDILLPPNCLDGPVFEHWSGGGRLRRCDGERCEVLADGPSGPEYQLSQGCPCEDEARAKGAQWDPGDVLAMPRVCKLKMRLTVLLPQFQLAGAWRIDTGSVNAAQKIPAMVGMVQHLQANGLPAGYLYIMKSQAFGGRREFNEILIGLKKSADDINAQLSGGPSVSAVSIEGGRGRAELGQAPEPPPDREVLRGEVVDIGSAPSAVGGSKRRHPAGAGREPQSAGDLARLLRAMPGGYAEATRRIDAEAGEGDGTFLDAANIFADPRAFDCAMRLVEANQ